MVTQIDALDLKYEYNSLLIHSVITISWMPNNVFWSLLYILSFNTILCRFLIFYIIILLVYFNQEP